MRITLQNCPEHYLQKTFTFLVLDVLSTWPLLPWFVNTMKLRITQTHGDQKYVRVMRKFDLPDVHTIRSYCQLVKNLYLCLRSSYAMLRDVESLGVYCISKHRGWPDCWPRCLIDGTDVRGDYRPHWKAGWHFLNNSLIAICQLGDQVIELPEYKNQTPKCTDINGLTKFTKHLWPRSKIRSFTNSS